MWSQRGRDSSARIAHTDRPSGGARYHARRALRAVRRAGPGRSNGAVESARTSVAGVVHVTGWAYCSNEQIEAVVILVDGEPCTLAELGVARADVAAAFRYAPGSGRAGWSAKVALPESVGARVAIGAVAVTAAGLAERFDPVLITLASETG
jgi:hypothetical protein